MKKTLEGAALQDWSEAQVQRHADGERRQLLAIIVAMAYMRGATHALIDETERISGR